MKFFTCSTHKFPKIRKPGSHGITGNQTWITQPHSLYIVIELTPHVRALPNFLQDGDDLTRDLQRLRVRKNDIFLSFDIIRLYPSIDLRRCLDALNQFLVEKRFENQIRSLLVGLTEVILFENYCTFANRIWKAELGFATGVAFGREIAEIYLHMLERDLWTRFADRMLCSKRHVDDGFIVFRCALADVDRFARKYGMTVMPIEHEIDRESFVLLDTFASKSDVWQR
eukprot:SAG11_NODE_5595_length_1514_cov_5.951237_1_plen_226_part_10